MLPFHPDVGRQTPLVAFQRLKYDEIGAAPFVAVKLPPNALVLSAALNVITPFSGGTFAAVDDSAAPVLYADAVDAAAAGRNSASVAGTFYPAGAQITVTPPAGAQTAGLAYLEVQYVIAGRATETQP